jgi:hypothetical protein
MALFWENELVDISVCFLLLDVCLNMISISGSRFDSNCNQVSIMMCIHAVRSAAASYDFFLTNGEVLVLPESCV